jgi:hypothetical protein
MVVAFAAAQHKMQIQPTGKLTIEQIFVSLWK